MAYTYKKEFQDWVKKENINVLDSLPNSDLKIGDLVSFINEFGLKFENLEILGFRDNPDLMPDRRIYLDTISYWFAVKFHEVKKII